MVAVYFYKQICGRSINLYLCFSLEWFINSGCKRYGGNLSSKRWSMAVLFNNKQYAVRRGSTWWSVGDGLWDQKGWKRHWLEISIFVKNHNVHGIQSASSCGKHDLTVIWDHIFHMKKRTVFRETSGVLCITDGFLTCVVFISRGSSIIMREHKMGVNLCVDKGSGRLRNEQCHKCTSTRVGWKKHTG